MSGSRSWCFTINNYGIADEDRIHGWIADSKVKQAVVGREVAPSTGTIHLQGWVQFDLPRTPGWVKNFIGSNAHIERARSDYASKAYAGKVGDLVIDKTTLSMQGHRSDIDALVESLKKGGLRQAKIDCPSQLIKYPGGCRLYCSVTDPSPERLDIKVFAFIGTTGTGKSRAAFANKPHFRPYIGEAGRPWFDGYGAEPHLILDEYVGQYPYEILLGILDVYPMKIEVKGGMAEACWTTVTLTSNLNIQEWYPKKDISALLRRIHKIQYLPPYNYELPLPPTQEVPQIGA